MSNIATAQRTGQPPFSLEATEKDKFSFKQAGVKFEFNTTDKTMILLQAGQKITFTRE